MDGLGLNLKIKYMKKITATFIGRDGSMGYETNKRYKLRMRSLHGMIYISRDKGVSWLGYGTVISFLDNWDDVRNR